MVEKEEIFTAGLKVGILSTFVLVIILGTLFVGLQQHSKTINNLESICNRLGYEYTNHLKMGKWCCCHDSHESSQGEYCNDNRIGLHVSRQTSCKWKPKHYVKCQKFEGKDILNRTEIYVRYYPE